MHTKHLAMKHNIISLLLKIAETEIWSVCMETGRPGFVTINIDSVFEEMPNQWYFLLLCDRW